MAERKTSSPLEFPPPQNLSKIHIRHNTRPLRTRQPPLLLSERVFTTFAEESDEKPGEHRSTCLKTPMISSLEVVAVEVENQPVTFVDATPDSSPLRRSTPASSKLNREN